MEDATNMTRARGGFVYASETLAFNARQTIVCHLLLIVKGAFISPVKAYEAQVEANKCTQHISIAAKKQVAKSTADTTAEILEAEAAVDPKIVRVMIQQAVEKAVDKRMEKEKKGVQKQLRNKGQKKKQQQKPLNPTTTTMTTKKPQNNISKKSNGISRSPSPKKISGASCGATSTKKLTPNPHNITNAKAEDSGTGFTRDRGNSRWCSLKRMPLRSRSASKTKRGNLKITSKVK